jgi:hypothetical protein
MEGTNTGLFIVAAMNSHTVALRFRGSGSNLNRTFIRMLSPSRSRAFASSHVDMEANKSRHDLFEYTSGRWMYVSV